MASNGIGDLGKFDFMNRGMYPMSQIDRSYYATPTQVPLAAQSVQMDYDPATNPLTGEPVSRFADGGIANLKAGGTPEERRAAIADVYKKILGRDPNEGENLDQWYDYAENQQGIMNLADRLAQTEEGIAYGKSNPKDVFAASAALSQEDSPFKGMDTPYSNMRYMGGGTQIISGGETTPDSTATTYRFQDQNGGIVTADETGKPINYEPGRGWYDEQLRKHPDALRNYAYRNQTYLASGPLDKTYNINGMDVPVTAGEFQIDPKTGQFISGKTGDYAQLQLKPQDYSWFDDWGAPAMVVAIPAAAYAGTALAAGAAGTAAGGTAAGTAAGGTAAGTVAGGTAAGTTAGTVAGGAAAGTAASTTPAWMVAAGKGAAVGAAMGGGSAAMTGGDVVKGTIYGGITGAVGGAAGSAMGGGLTGNMAGGALAGGTGAALRGGNVAQGAGMGAVGGAINTGIGGLDASPETKDALQYVGKPLAMSTVMGALSGNQGGQGTNYGGTSGYGINAGSSGQYVPFNAGITPIPSVYNPTAANPFAISGMMPNDLYYGYKPATFNYGNQGIQSGYDGYGLRYAQGGIADLGSYSDGGRLLKGPGDGMSDDIPASIGDKQPARLADGEFVIPADVVSHLGNGSTDAGAKHLYKMMDKIRQARTGNKKQGKQINPDKFLPKE